MSGMRSYTQKNWLNTSHDVAIPWTAQDRNICPSTGEPLTGSLTTNGNGIPDFLTFDVWQLDAAAEWASRVDPVVKSFKGDEKKLIAAIGATILDSIAGQNLEEASALLQTFRKIWRLGLKWHGQNDRAIGKSEKIPPVIKSFLHPLILNKDTATKLLITILHYDIDTIDSDDYLTADNRTAIDSLVGDFVTHVVFAQCFSTFCYATGVRLNKRFLALFNNYRLRNKTGTFIIDTIVDRLIPIVKAHLFGGRSIDKIIGLTLAGYPRKMFPDTLLRKKLLCAWHPLTLETDQIFETHRSLRPIIIHELTDNTELVLESELVSHCALKHVQACLQGDEHFFSIRAEGERIPLATFVVKQGTATKDYIIVDCEGPEKSTKDPITRKMRKAPPTEVASDAAHWFITELNAGRLVKNAARGETDQSKKTDERLSDLVYLVGYEITPENADLAFKEYCCNTNRRALEYNVQSGNFDIQSKTTHLISGDGFKPTGASGGIKISHNFRKMRAATWFDASGLSAKIMPIFYELISAYIMEIGASNHLWLGAAIKSLSPDARGKAALTSMYGRLARVIAFLRRRALQFSFRTLVKT